MMRKLLFTVLFAILATGMNAQIKGSSVYLGGVMPHQGYSLGATVGYKYQWDLPVAGLGIVAGSDVILYGLGKKAGDAYKAQYDQISSYYGYDKNDYEIKLTKPLYFNIPVTVGVNYSFPIKNIRLWAEARIGANLALQPTTKYSAYKWHNNEISHQSGNTHYYIDTRHKPAVSLAWNTGVGVLLKDTFSFSLALQEIGKYKDKAVVTEDYKQYYNSSKNAYTKETESSTDIKTGLMVQLRIGYHF